MPKSRKALKKSWRDPKPDPKVIASMAPFMDVELLKTVRRVDEAWRQVADDELRKRGIPIP